MADMALRNTDDALDVLQEAMISMAQSYSGKPADEWLPLFYRILQNKIRDAKRRAFFRFSWMIERSDDVDKQAVDLRPEPSQQSEARQAGKKFIESMSALPARQQQAVSLRLLEGMDVRQTAISMGCSEGSVKTHYSRGVHSLRKSLKDYWP